MWPRPAAIVGVLLGLALILPACGDERTPAAGKVAATPSKVQAKRPAAAAAGAKRCQGLLGEFLDSMESLRNLLAVGLSYEDYLRQVGGVRAVYAGVPAKRLAIACLVRVGTPGERALNVYIDGVNVWGDCLASASCDPESVEPRLQRKWRRASGFLSTAESGLRDLRSATAS